MANDLDTIPRKKLTKRQLAELSSFTDPAVILSLLSKYEWTIDKSIQNLVDIATNATKEATRLAAIRYLNQLQLDAMQRSGMIVTARGRIGPGGDEEITFTGSVISNSLKSQKESPADETKIEEIITIKDKKDKSDAEVPEENPKEVEAVGEEILNANAAADVDMHICKPPEGKYNEDGQFDGIATSTASPSLPNTIHIF